MKSRAVLFAPAAGFLACERPIFRVANRSLPFCAMQCRLNERVHLCALAGCKRPHILIRLNVRLGCAP
jgi:hypothetical protein